MAQAGRELRVKYGATAVAPALRLRRQRLDTQPQPGSLGSAYALRTWGTAATPRLGFREDSLDHVSFLQEFNSAHTQRR